MIAHAVSQAFFRCGAGNKVRNQLRSSRKKRALFALGAAGLMAVPVTAMPGDLAMLSTLSKGSWTIRVRDDGSQEKICVRNGTEFIQLRHRQPACSRFIVKDAADEVVVQYNCRGTGYGMTTIRRESPELVQIQSQGIFNGKPFAISGEARRSGRC